MLRRALAAAGLVLLLASPALAQERLEDRALGPLPSQVVAAKDLNRKVGGKGVQVLWDPATGCPRQVRFKRPMALKARTPDDATTEVLERLASLYGSRHAPRLTKVRVRNAGTRRIAVFEQRVGDALLEGATLQIVLARRKKRIYALKVIGRVYRDAPLALDTLPVPAGKRLSLGPLQLEGTEPRLIGTPRGGTWQPAIQTAATDADGVPVRVLKDRDGKLLAKTPLVCMGGVRGKIYPFDPDRGGLTSRPLKDLWVRTRDGRALTDSAGGFPGRYGSLPGGLQGKFEQVLHDGAPYPRTSRGRLSLDYSGDDLRLDEVNVYYHLVETRRWLSQWSRVPGVQAALQATNVAVVGSEDFNALAAPTACLVGTRRFDNAMIFGNIVGMSSRDGTVITHERMHTLQYAMGVGVGAEIQEALADYFAADRFNNPKVGRYAMGPAVRDVSEFRHWPEDKTDDSHVTGLILAGALWDARRELGSQAVGGHVLAALPSDELTDFAQAVVDGAPEQPAAVLRKHFVRHGLIDDAEVNTPPLIKIASQPLPKPASAEPSDAQQEEEPATQEEEPATQEEEPAEPTDLDMDIFLIKRQDLETERGQLIVTATDPEERPLTLTLSGFEDVDSVTTSVQQGSPAVGRVLFDGDMECGSYTLTATAQDDGGETSMRILTVYVYEHHETPDVQDRVILHAQVGKQLKRSVLDLAQPEEGESRTTLAQLGRFRLQGPRVGNATIADGNLLIEPREGEEGVHEMQLMVKSREVQREVPVRLTIVVGDSGPWISAEQVLPTREYYERRHGDSSTTPDSSLVPLPPGRPLTVELGETAELHLVGHAFRPGEATNYAPVELSLEDLPAGIELVLAKAQPVAVGATSPLGRIEAEIGGDDEWGDDDWNDEQTWSDEEDDWEERPSKPLGQPQRLYKYPARLYVTPEPGTAVRTAEVTLVAKAGDKVHKRKLTLLVVPAQDGGHQPVIEAPATVRLDPNGHVPFADFEIRVSDPDGKELPRDALTVVSPDGDQPSARVSQPRPRMALLDLDGNPIEPASEGVENPTHAIYATGRSEFTVVLRARDADGDVAIARIRVLAPATDDAGKEPEQKGGAIEGLERK